MQEFNIDDNCYLVDDGNVFPIIILGKKKTRGKNTFTYTYSFEDYEYDTEQKYDTLCKTLEDAKSTLILNRAKNRQESHKRFEDSIKQSESELKWDLEYIEEEFNKGLDNIEKLKAAGG